MYDRIRTSAMVLLLALTPPLASAQEHRHDPAMHIQHAPAASPAAQAMPADTRMPVAYPAMLKEHTLANMRDHLRALQQMQAALAKEDFSALAEIAERRLGMSSLQLHGAHEVAQFMPKGMQDAGTAMHRSASRLAIVAGDAAASGQVKPVVGALADLTATCVACHAGYRLE